jgi:2-polyprenyl-6-hydroxyphenyl methylase/3-demethylubiquinone-9 3-methyltransferase
MPDMPSADRERSEKRFAFGKNWKRFHSVLDDSRIAIAQASLQEMLRVDRLDGKTFLDIGSGSGLFSLVARRLGATVVSFDYDSESVECTERLKAVHCPGDDRWTIMQGSVLDESFLEQLGRFDVVYSWGVLHHTGQMWRAMDLASKRVAPEGRFFIMIYRDEGWHSAMWKTVKRWYCSGPVQRAVLFTLLTPIRFGKRIVLDLLCFRNPWRRFADYKKHRGMSRWHDWIDWLGGYPFEYATIDQVVDFAAERGFVLSKIKKTQYVFESTHERAEQSETNSLRAAG